MESHIIDVLDGYYRERMIKDRFEGKLVNMLNRYDELRHYDRGQTINMPPVDAARTWIHRDRDASIARKIVQDAANLIEDALVALPNADPTSHDNEPRVDITQRLFLDYLEGGLLYISTPIELNNEWMSNHLIELRDQWYRVEAKTLELLKEHGIESRTD